MLKKKFSNAKVRLALGILNTPIKMPLAPVNQVLAMRAAIEFKRLCDESIKMTTNGKSFVVHRFTPQNKRAKVLVVHGWLSKTTYMMNFVRHLYYQGYEVFAMDLPGHGKSSRDDLHWKESVHLILEVQKRFGKFDLALGHSYGGAMLLNSTVISKIVPEFKTALDVEKMVLLAAPTSALTAVNMLSDLLGLNSTETENLGLSLMNDESIDINHVCSVYLKNELPSKTKFLCLHDPKDRVVPYNDSVRFSQASEQVKLITKEGLGHVRILSDQTVLNDINEFIRN